MANGPISYAVGPTVLGSSVNVGFSDGPALDAFGRLRTSSTANRFDLEFIYDKQPLLVDEVIGASGTATHNSSSRDVTLAVGAATASDSAELFSHFDIPYTPGNSQLIDITGTLNDADLSSTTVRFFLRSTVSGSTTTTYYEQANWDNTLADIDWTKSQILSMDYQSLKVGRIRAALVKGGVATPFLTIENDNLRDSGYWQTPTLPINWRIYNDATYTYAEMGLGDSSNGIGLQLRVAVNASATMRAICSTVKSEGGAALLDLPGFPMSASNVTTAVTVSSTLIPVLSIRVASTINSLTNRGLFLPTGYEIVGSNPMHYQILYRPTLTGPSWTAVDATYSGMEYDITASAVSGGVVVDAGYFASGRNTLGSESALLDRVIMALGRTGTSDILTLAAVRTTASDSSTYSAWKWREIR